MRSTTTRLRTPRFSRPRGGAWIVPERELTPEALARRLASLMDDPAALERAAAAAKAEGRVDAAERLADLAEELSREGQTVPARNGG